MDKLAKDPDTPRDHVHFLELELGSLRSIEAAVAAFRKKQQRLDLLFHCAAVLDPNGGHTKDGFELHFGVNALGPYYLTRLLVPLLLRSYQQNPVRPPRVCFLSCWHHTQATSKGFDLMDPSGEKMSRIVPAYYQAYANSKMCNVMTACRLNSEYARDGIIFCSCNPGNISTGITRHITNLSSVLVGQLLGQAMLYPADKGAITPLYAATAEETAEEGGLYYVPWARVGEPAAAAKNEDAQNTSTPRLLTAVIQFFDKLISLRSASH